MAYNNLNDWATSICDAIREKEGSSDLIPAPDIPERIRGIQSGGDAAILQTSSMGMANSGSEIANVLQTSSMGMANSGSEIANVLQTEVTCSVSD